MFVCCHEYLMIDNLSVSSQVHPLRKLACSWLWPTNCCDRFCLSFETGSHSVAQTDPELTVICLSQHQPLLVGTDCTLGVSHEEHWELVHVCKRVYSDWHVASNFPFLQCLNFWNQVFADYKNEFECSPLLRFSGHILDNHYLLLKFLWPPSWLQFFFLVLFFWEWFYLP